MTDTSVPEWVVLVVGRLTLENEALRRALTPPPPPPDPEQTAND